MRRNRTGTGQKVQIFDVIIFFKLRTIQQKTVKPTCLCPLGARKLFRLIKKRSFNLLCVLDLKTLTQVRGKPVKECTPYTVSHLKLL